jgi:hypothetical protein
LAERVFGALGEEPLKSDIEPVGSPEAQNGFRRACLSGAVKYVGLAHAATEDESRLEFCEIAEGYLNAALSRIEQEKARWLYEAFEPSFQRMFGSIPVGWRILDEAMLAIHHRKVSRNTREAIWTTVKLLMRKAALVRPAGQDVGYFFSAIEPLVNTNKVKQETELEVLLKLENLQIALLHNI